MKMECYIVNALIVRGGVEVSVCCRVGVYNESVIGEVFCQDQRIDVCDLISLKSTFDCFVIVDGHF